MGDITTYNGAAIIAMKGKNCAIIAADTRYGIQHQTQSTNMQKLFQMHDKLFVGFAGLATDMQTLEEKLQFRTNLYKLREERDISPKAFSTMVGKLLFKHRFGPWFVEPIIAGLDKDGNPFLNAMDSIGAPQVEEGFVAVGTCSTALYGMAEALYRPDLEVEDLFEVCSQTLLAAVDRDAFSGWGAVVHILTPEKLITRTLKARQD